MRVGPRAAPGNRVAPGEGAGRVSYSVGLAVLAAVIATTPGSMFGTESTEQQVPTAFRELQLGYIDLDARDFEGALVHYQRARELAKTREHRFNALLGYGSAAFELQRYGEARQALEEAHAIKPEDAEATFTLGVVCRREGDVERAVQYLAEAAARDPSLTAALVELAIAYGALDRHHDAESACRTALTQDPDNTEAGLGLGVALYHQNKHEEAVTAFRRVLELDADNPRAHFGLGLALLYSGDRAGAVREVVFLNQKSPALAEELHGWVFPDD